MATNYNKVKWGTDTPSVIAWKADASHTYYPGIVKWGSDVVFARAVDVDGSTTKTGLSGIASSLTAFTVPTNVSRASGYFYGDQITATATYQTYWTGSTTATKSLTELFSLTTSTTPSKYYLRDLFTPSRTGTRSITVTGDAHVNVSAAYTKLDGTAGAVSTKSTTSQTVNDAWQGAVITASYAVDTYYKTVTVSGMGVTPIGTANVTATATSTQKVRQVTVKKVTNTHAAASSFVVSYYSNASTSVSKTAAGTYDSFSGKDVTWVVNAPAYCTAVSPSGTVAAANNENAITVDTGCTRNARTLAVKGDSHARVTITYTNTSGATGQTITTKSTTATSTTTAWQGAAASAGVVYDTYYTKSTESNIGTIAIGNTTVTASATSQEKKRRIDVSLTNVASVTVKYKSTADASVTTTTPTASGTVTLNSFSGAKVTWNGATAATYWTLSTTSGEINAADNTATVTITAAATRRARSVVLSGANCNFTVNYRNLSDSPTTKTAVAAQTLTDVWSGAALTAAVAANTYWSLSASSGTGTINASENAHTVSGTVVRKMRTITNSSSSPLSVTITYYNSSGTQITTNNVVGAGSSVSAWCGQNTTYQYAAAPTYVTNSNPSGTITANDTNAAVTLSPSLSGLARTLKTQVTYNQSLVESLANNVTLRLNGAACYGTGAYTNYDWSQTSSQAPSRDIAQGSTYTLQGLSLPSAATYYTISPSSCNIGQGSSTVTREFEIVRRPRTVKFQSTGDTGCSIVVDYGSYDSTTSNGVAGTVVTLTNGGTSSHQVPNYWSGNAGDDDEIDYTLPHGTIRVNSQDLSAYINSRPFTSIGQSIYNNTVNVSTVEGFPVAGTSDKTYTLLLESGYYVDVPTPGLGRNNIVFGICNYNTWSSSQPSTMNGTTVTTVSSRKYVGVSTVNMLVWYSTLKPYFTATTAGTTNSNYGKVTYGDVSSSRNYYSITTPTASPVVRPVHIKKASIITYALSSMQLKACNSTNTASGTWNIGINTTTGLVNTWLGAPATLTAVANSYWTATGTGTVVTGNPSSGTYTFNVSAQLLTYRDEVQQDGTVDIDIYNPTSTAMYMKIDSMDCYDADGNYLQSPIATPTTTLIGAGRHYTFTISADRDIYEYEIRLWGSIGVGTGVPTFYCWASG